MPFPKIRQDIVDREPLLSVDQVAERLGVSRRSIYRQIESGHLPALKIGRSRRVTQSAVDALIRRSSS